eukprot:FR740556.1.p1 GENE.FR740556.1~~FR740556.1.p1  ORF type:complete len:216 (+),score=25.48 FR740556.1:41-649(+)
MLAGMQALMAPVSRDRLCNDLMNTSVMAALIGGFALNSLEAPGGSTAADDGAADDQVFSSQTSQMDQYIYICAYISVHACTCSALTSAFIYATVNNMEDHSVHPWSEKCKLLLMLPMMKFIAGAMAYMTSVILTAWKDLEELPVLRWIAIAIGSMSIGSVWVSFVCIKLSTRKEPLLKAVLPAKVLPMAPARARSAESKVTG